MNFTKVFSISLLAASMSVASVYADTMDKKQVEQIVHDYLVSNPEVLVEASQALQTKQQAMMQEQAKTAIAGNGPSLTSGKYTIAGNPNGDVTLVEFFDYQCIHCVKMKPIVDSLIKKNPNLRVVYKELPIFGKESEMASRLAITAALQGKYLRLQNALFDTDHHLTEEKIMAVAKSSGMNMATLKTDMQSKEVTNILEESRKLAESIHLMGTPAFVILTTPNGKFRQNSNPTFIPGASTEASLQELINKAAKK